MKFTRFMLCIINLFYVIFLFTTCLFVVISYELVYLKLCQSNCQGGECRKLTRHQIASSSGSKCERNGVHIKHVTTSEFVVV